MTAKDLIDAGYRLHEVEVTYRIPVLCKPEEVHSLDAFDVKRWIDEDGNDPEEVHGIVLRALPADWRGSLPFDTADLDDDPPKCEDLFAAQQGVPA